MTGCHFPLQRKCVFRLLFVTANNSKVKILHAYICRYPSDRTSFHSNTILRTRRLLVIYLYNVSFKIRNYIHNKMKIKLRKSQPKKVRITKVLKTTRKMGIKWQWASVVEAFRRRFYWISWCSVHLTRKFYNVFVAWNKATGTRGNNLTIYFSYTKRL